MLYGYRAIVASARACIQHTVHKIDVSEDSNLVISAGFVRVCRTGDRAEEEEVSFFVYKLN